MMQRIERYDLVRSSRWILAAAVVSSVIHYTDNYLRIERYPQPAWIDHGVIWGAWLLFTAFGALGYWLLRGGWLSAAGASFIVYSYTGLSSLGHYRFGAMSEFDLRMHLFIWTDGITGALVLLLGVSCLAAARTKRMTLTTT